VELEKTVERIVPKNFKSREEYLLYLRHVFVYEVLKYKLKDSDQVLEIGFGEGYGTHLISGYVDSVIGLDVEEKAVEYANKKYGSGNCSFQTYDGSKIPFEENTFDSIVSYQVIEHVEKDENFLKEIHRVLQDQGKLYLTTPNRLHRLAPGEEPWNPFHEREYSPEQLRELMDNIFSEVNIFGVNAEQEVWQIEVDRVKRGITLKKLMPNALKRFIYGDFMNQYDTDSFFLDEDASTGLDLFAICTKKKN
jgi:ubiquinone/menaquinone biosynthesis C-methylase UbiE